jgi:hypothetical protein
MALIKNHRMTEKNRSARQRNGRQSRGAATAEGKERSHAANLKHGYYSQLRDEALIALGEDPAALAALVAGVHEQFEPANAMQAAMAEHLAHLHWRMLRAERLQESTLVCYIQKVEERRRQQALRVRTLYEELSDFLWVLRSAVGRSDFHALPGFIRQFQAGMKYDSDTLMKDILHLLYCLRRPQRFSDPLPPPMPEAMSDDDWEISPTIYGEGDEPVPPPQEMAVAEGEERDELRVELRQLIEQEIRLNGKRWEKTLAEHQAPLPQVERDRLAGVVHDNTALLRRDESSCSREFWRTANMLIKFQAGKDKNESEVRGPAFGVKGKSEASIPDSEVNATGACEFSTPNSAPPTPNTELNTPNSLLTPDTRRRTPSSKNAGASGDIHENKGSRKKNSAIKRQIPGPSDAPEFPKHAERSDTKSEPCTPEQGHLPQRPRVAA